MGESAADGSTQFDFDAHADEALDRYRGRHRHYEDCAKLVEGLVTSALGAEGLQVHSIEARAKSLDSFKRKAARPAEGDSQAPRYADPLTDMTDLSAVRVITFFLETVQRVVTVIEREFVVVEKENKSSLLAVNKQLGYQSIHFLVKLSESRTRLPEYGRFAETVVEIQIRTILQHAWAEIEHDIQYKSVEALPESIGQRFMSLAGLLEIADREFQAIASKDRDLRNDAGRLIDQGKLSSVEITADALKLYLDKKLGSDMRMSDWNYGWNAANLKRLGFGNLEQLDKCIAPFNHDKVSRAIWGGRQGQLQRFEDVLLAAMSNGEAFRTRHRWANEEFFEDWRTRRIATLAQAGIDVGSFDPMQA